MDPRPWGRFTCTSVSPLVTIRYHKFLFFSIGILYKLYKSKLETLTIPRLKQRDQLVFVEYTLSLRTSAHTGVAIPRLKGTR